LAARSLKTNPVVVRRLLKSLEGQGLVTIRQGRYGGVALARSPHDITLRDIRAAVDGGGDLFALRERGNPRCPVSRAMAGLLKPVFLSAGMAAEEALARTRLSDLVDRITESYPK
jgi:DNA-binding IscR family transcriptional regulator